MVPYASALANARHLQEVLRTTAGSLRLMGADPGGAVTGRGCRANLDAVWSFAHCFLGEQTGARVSRKVSPGHSSSMAEAI
jgi:hypothetical protein